MLGESTDWVKRIHATVPSREKDNRTIEEQGLILFYKECRQLRMEDVVLKQARQSQEITRHMKAARIRVDNP